MQKFLYKYININLAIIINSTVKMSLLLVLMGNYVSIGYAQNEVKEIEYMTFVENYQVSNSKVVFPIVSKARRSTSSDGLKIHKIYETDMPDTLDLCIKAAIDLWEKSLEDVGINLTLSFSYVEMQNDIETSVAYQRNEEIYYPTSLARKIGIETSGGSLLDAYIKINKNTKWMCNHSVDVDNNGINLTNAILRNIAVALGFGSSVIENPKSPRTVKFFYSVGHSAFDNMLASSDGSKMESIPNKGARLNQELTDFALGKNGDVYVLNDNKEYKMYTPSSYEPKKSLVYLDNPASLMNWDMSVASKNLQIDDVTKNILKALGWSPIQRKEDVKIFGRDIDSTGLASSYIEHDFYIGGADANYLDNICWKYILPSVEGKENIVIQKNNTKEFTIPKIDDVNKYLININGDIDAKIVLEGEVRGVKISCVYNLALELKPRIKNVEIVKFVSNMPKYDSYDVYYNVKYSGSDELQVGVEEEYSGAIATQIIKEPYYAHVKSTNITAPYYAWIDICAENKYGKDVYTLELPPFVDMQNKLSEKSNQQMVINKFVVKDLFGNTKFLTNSCNDLHKLPMGVYFVEAYSNGIKIKTIKYYKK